MGRRTSTA